MRVFAESAPLTRILTLGSDRMDALKVIHYMMDHFCNATESHEYVLK